MEIVLVVALVALIPLFIAIVVFFIKRSLGQETVRKVPAEGKRNVRAKRQGSFGCLVPVIILIAAAVTNPQKVDHVKRVKEGVRVEARRRGAAENLAAQFGVTDFVVDISGAIRSQVSQLYHLFHPDIKRKNNFSRLV